MDAKSFSDVMTGSVRCPKAEMRLQDIHLATTKKNLSFGKREFEFSDTYHYFLFLQRSS